MENQMVRRALFLSSFNSILSLSLSSEYIETSPNPLVRRHRKTIEKKPVNSLTRVAFWGLTVTVGGLAIFLWNQSQYLDSEKLLHLGDLFH